MADSCSRRALALRELESLASLRPAGLFALDRASIARQQAEIAKLAAVRLIEGDERAGDGETQRARLTRLPTSIDVRANIEPAKGIRGRERLLDGRHERGTRK